jgi:hypothetical protein
VTAPSQRSMRRDSSGPEKVYGGRWAEAEGGEGGEGERAVLSGVQG